MYQLNLRFLNALVVLTLIGAVALPYAAHAQTAVVPGANAATAGDTFYGWNGGDALTVQQLYTGSLLSDLPSNVNITGMRFRQQGGGVAVTAPIIGYNFANFDVRLGTSLNSVGSLSTTFASNYGADTTLVRSGALTWAANSFPGGAIPNDWGPLISFSTPYLYTGSNDLLLSFSYSAGGGSFLATDVTTTGLAGLAQFQQRVGYNAATAAFSLVGAKIVQFEYQVVSSSAPEPGTLVLLTLGGVAVLAKRRRRQS